MLRTEGGSAPLHSVFAIALFMLLVTGVVEVALVLYGRNMVSASAHEAARAAVELGRDLQSARVIATRTVEDSAGGLVEDLDVTVAVEELGARSVVVVEVRGQLHPPGPIPFTPRIRARATAAKEAHVR